MTKKPQPLVPWWKSLLPVKVSVDYVERPVGPMRHKEVEHMWLGRCWKISDHTIEHLVENTSG